VTDLGPNGLNVQHPIHPKIGVEYEATEDTDAVDAGASYVPIEWDGTGNLVVAEYDTGDDGTRAWNGDAFVEHVQNGQLVERNLQ
jgi:hypothetical protein